MKKLWRVKCEFETVVAAEHSADIPRAVMENAVEIASEEADSYEIHNLGEIKDVPDLPPRWTGYCIPWGTEDHVRIQDYFKPKEGWVHQGAILYRKCPVPRKYGNEYVRVRVIE